MIHWVGAILVIAAGSLCGFSMARSYSALEQGLRQLVVGLEIMHCQIQYRLTTVPELCRILSAACTGTVAQVFSDLEAALEQEDACRLPLSMAEALRQNPELPEPCVRSFRRIGQMLGQMDLQSQLKSIELETERLRGTLRQVAEERPGRVKSYRTLGIGCGVALAIVLL